VTTLTQPRREAPPAAAGAPRRLDWCDVGRALAIAVVIVIHVVASTVHTEPRGSRVWWFGDVVDAATRWPVPVFIMISGALLLPKREPVGRFTRKRLVRVAIPTLAWTAIYEAWRILRLDASPSPTRIAKDILEANPWYHLYFLFIVLGLYALTPFLRQALPHISRNVLLGTTALIILGASAHNTITTWHATGDGGLFVYSVWYLGYYLLGYVLRDVTLSRRQIAMAAGGLAATIAAHALAVPVLWTVFGGRWSYYPASYFSLFTIVISVLVFVLLQQIRLSSDRSRRIFGTLSAASFGVYLVHPILLWDIRKPVLHYGHTNIPVLLYVTAATMVASFALVLLVRKTALGRLLMP
jgi:surface polysaccharide O-acyltransferase-like enzyme